MGSPTPPSDVIPPERERNFRRKPGFDYLLVTIEFQKGKKFGLGMVDTENRVLINKVDDDSMCSECLKTFDRICDVEGIPVTDKEFCKKQIVKGLKKDQKVSLAIERPVTKERVTQVEHLLKMMSQQPPSVILEVDVRDIIARYSRRLTKGQIGPEHKALKGKEDRPKPAAKVSLDANQPEVVSIGMDREHLQEDLEKVPVKTYENSLARLQNQGSDGKNGQSITTMIQPEASKDQPKQDTNPPPPQLVNIIAPPAQSPRPEPEKK
ncbi:hypothetical protein RB195_009185 [Necator americanus]|uniref:PDZ domain-containing protein n=1 Tax=Necator americanus TaxID=51031 RepID=A0ABR1CS70_NECAM